MLTNDQIRRVGSVYTGEAGAVERSTQTTGGRRKRGARFSRT